MTALDALMTHAGRTDAPSPDQALGLVGALLSRPADQAVQNAAQSPVDVVEVFEQPRRG